MLFDTMRFHVPLLLAALSPPLAAVAQPAPVEIHDRIVSRTTPDKRVALTLDACGGNYDGALIEFLIRNRIPATIFATRIWLRRNPQGLAVINAHLDLFDVEDHGEKHIPAIIGKDRTVYGLHGEPDVVHLRREVVEGARAVEAATGVAPHLYRGATGEYDAQSISEIDKLGYRIAGFSVNADNGATLNKHSIEKRLAHVQAGDVIIAHMNKPASDTAAGLASGLAHLLESGFVFVRLDQVDLKVLPEKP